MNQIIFKKLDPTAAQEDLSAESLICLSKEVIATASVPTDEEILSSVLVGDNNVDDEELQPGDIDFDTEGHKSSSWDELEGTLDAMQNASVSSQQLGRNKFLSNEIAESL